MTRVDVVVVTLVIGLAVLRLVWGTPQTAATNLITVRNVGAALCGRPHKTRRPRR